MSNNTAVIDLWLDTWTQEFGRAVEMFSGKQPTITYSRARALAPTEMGDLLWWKQVFHAGDHTFDNWIGAKEATWMALGAAAGDPEPQAAEAAYLEIIGQAQHGTASVIGAQSGKTLRAGDGQLGTAPDFHSLAYALIGIQLDGVELPSLAIALDPQVSQILTASEPKEIAPGPMALVPRGHQPEDSMAPMLSRLMDLELPLSIALGRARMPIHEVLKVTAGSLIELDRNIGDPVELIVHGTVVARGEVVSVRGNYGVRIKEIISRQDRISLYAAQ